MLERTYRALWSRIGGRPSRLLALVFLPRSPRIAGPASTTPTAKARVYEVEGMSIRTVGSGRTRCEYRFATKYVDPLLNRLQVRRIHAPGIATQVVNDHAFWNRAVRRLIRKTVGVDRAPTPVADEADTEGAISIPASPSLPGPAFVLPFMFNERPKALLGAFITTRQEPAG